jgi:hypothetical protein
VTNNRNDFLALARSVDLHAGLVIILPSRRREAQAPSSRPPCAGCASSVR